MSKIRWVVLLLSVLGIVGVSLMVSAERKDALGSIGRHLPLFLQVEEFYTDDMLDSGCSLVYCRGDCDQWDTGWKCWTQASYERYGYDEEGRHDLPISISAVGDCTVVHLWTSTVYCSNSNSGSGRVSTQTSCWINVIFSGSGWNDGYCTCTEL